MSRPLHKLAIIQNGDTPQLESTAAMLRVAGYESRYCGKAVRDALQAAGCDTVISLQSMLDVGYDPLDPTIGEASLRDMDRCDFFLEIKVRNLEKIWRRWPRLRNRTAWLRVNGGEPEHVIRRDASGKVTEDCGDETKPPCPVITANLWYGQPQYNSDEQNYVFWPPYPREADYLRIDRSNLTSASYAPPFCLCHGIWGWGFKEIVPNAVEMGVRIYGTGSMLSPIPHSKVPDLVATSIAMVHLKSVDCPGWAIYEAMLGGCPVILSRLLINRMLGHELFEEGVTCLAFGLGGDEHGRGDVNFPLCLREIKAALERLRDPAENRRIGEAGRSRLRSLMWSVEKDGEAFREYMGRVFP